MLVTTHYLDEAEHCHRVAIIDAGSLAALGSTRELKQVFEGRAIVEVRAARPVEAMRLLDGMPDVEKTSVFGTAVHVVLRTGAAGAESVGKRLSEAGMPVTSVTTVPAVSRRCLPRSGEPAAVMIFTRAMAVGRKEIRQIVRDKLTLTILLFVPAFFLLLFGYALSWDIRGIRIAVDDRDRTADSRALVSAFVDSGYFALVAAPDERRRR